MTYSTLLSMTQGTDSRIHTMLEERRNVQMAAIVVTLSWSDEKVQYSKELSSSSSLGNRLSPISLNTVNQTTPRKIARTVPMSYVGHRKVQLQCQRSQRTSTRPFCRLPSPSLMCHKGVPHKRLMATSAQGGCIAWGL